MNFKRWLLSEGLDAVKIHLPSVRQSHNYDCGAAALRAVCEFFKVGPDDHDEFIKACKTGTKHGTDVHDLIRAASSFGLNTKPMEGMSLDQLTSFVDMGRPVIVCMQAWDETPEKKKNYKKLESGHYVVVIGHDNNSIYIEDPVFEGSRGILPRKEFEKRWHDKDGDGKQYHHFGLVLWKPMGWEATDTQNITKKKKVP